MEAIYHPLAAGDKVVYMPHPSTTGWAIGTGWLDAVVAKVHTTRLCDVTVTLGEHETRLVRLVPFLNPGEPNPHSLMGRCQLARDRQEIGEGDVGYVSAVLGVGKLSE